MKLKSVRIREFKSIWDSGSFDTGHVTCLVGKNEAGKTAVLQALYRLNPIIETDNKFEVTYDYPKVDVENYLQDVESGRRAPATVTEATFTLDVPELHDITNMLGADALARPEIIVTKGYADTNPAVSIPFNETAIVAFLVAAYTLPADLLQQCASAPTITRLQSLLETDGVRREKTAEAARTKANALGDETAKAAALDEAKTLGESEQAKELKARVAELQKAPGLSKTVWESILKPRFPKFLYFSEYYQMRGHENINALKQRRDDNNGANLKPSDRPLLGLIELARIDLAKILQVTQTQELKNKLQGASNHLSGQVLKYWSQNRHLRMNFDVRQAMPQDPEGMREGMNIWAEVFDQKHLVSTGVSTRSTGFVWFFSFLAWYSAQKKKDEPLVLLLDEPGLSLHGRAQEDLLKYFEAEIATNPKHQLIYTTHSPFMVDHQHYDRVRIVQDRSIDTHDQLPREEDGTKVFTDVLEAGRDSLFPLQGALGYEIYQNLFIGPNSLIVEGVSDLMYLQTVSGLLQSAGRVGLDSRWTITPVGGSDKVPTFVALIGAQSNLNVATLIDFQAGDQQMVENLYKKKLLERSHVLTFADFTNTREADIEDMFDEDVYLQFVNAEFAAALAAPVARTDLSGHAPRILVRLDSHFARHPLTNGVRFNHYRPARRFSEAPSTFPLPATTLDRFEAAFRAVNALLPRT